MTYIYSTSGANVKFTGTTVYKTSDDPVVRKRIHEQFIWLSQHQTPALPRLYESWDAGYSMEKLDIIDWYRVDANNMWLKMLVHICVSAHEVWSQPAETTTEIYRFFQFLSPRLELAPSLFIPMNNWTDEMDHTKGLTHCLTHGDLTFDNTCIRKRTSKIVFIDPNPRDEVPQMWAADLAMICQSLLGYEHYKYGHPMPRISLIDLRNLLTVSDQDWMATMYFTAAKFIRILHYETELRPIFTKIATNIIEEYGYL